MKKINKTNTIILLIGLFVVTLSSCEKGSERSQKIEFDKNYKKWQTNAFSNYKFVEKRDCFCVGNGPFEITVNNKVIVAVKNNAGEDIAFNNLGLKTIDELFLYTKTSLEANPDKAEITYNSEFGYPENVYFDFEEKSIDDEIRYTVTAFAKTP